MLLLSYLRDIFLNMAPNAGKENGVTEQNGYEALLQRLEFDVRQHIRVWKPLPA